MVVIKAIVRFFAVLLGWLPYLIFRRTRVYHEDPKSKSRPLKGPAILIQNHTSMMDYFTVMFTFPFKKIQTLVADVVYKHPVPGTLSKLMDDICIHRERSDLSWMDKAEKALKKGHAVSIFPEGHIMRNGEIDSFKPSVVYLALRTGAPIVPMYIDGNYSSIKRTRVVVGKRIYLKDYCDEENPSIEKVRELCEMLRQKVIELKHLLKLYRKMHTQDIFYPHAWFLDFVKISCFIPTYLFWPIKYHYVGNASRKDRKLVGRSLVASKHFFFDDGPILQMHYFGRRLHTLVTSEFYQSAAWLLEHLFTIKYDRSTNNMDPRAFMEIINLLRANGAVGIYPEGHLSEGGIGEIQEGVSYFAFMTNTPIHFYWHMNKWKFGRRNHIMIGETIYPDQIFTKEELKDKKNVAKLHELVKARIYELHEAGQKYIRKPKNIKKIDKK